jgi:hypothetical protein
MDKRHVRCSSIILSVVEKAEQYTSGDPSNITIYLVTYNGSTIINNLPALTWATSAGSTYIHMTENPVNGYVDF